MFGGEDLKAFIEQASWVTVNDYEWSMMAERTGWDEAAVTKKVAALIVTHGGNGSTVFTQGGKLEFRPRRPARWFDPTGCGDAYRAGLLHGLIHGLPWEKNGAHRVTDGFAQDRVARHAESRLHGGPVPPALRITFRCNVNRNQRGRDST